MTRSESDANRALSTPVRASRKPARPQARKPAHVHGMADIVFFLGLFAFCVWGLS